MGDVEEIISCCDDLGQRSSLLIVEWQVWCRSSSAGLSSSVKFVNNIAGSISLSQKYINFRLSKKELIETETALLQIIVSDVVGQALPWQG